MEFPSKTGSLAESPALKAQHGWSRLWASASAKVAELRSHLVQRILRHRQTALVFALSFLVLLELIEHLILLRQGEDLRGWYDALIFGLVTPPTLWLLYGLLDSAESERRKIAVDGNLYSEFSQKLGEARNWDELVRQIVVYSQRLAPRASVTLFIHNPTTLLMQAEAMCMRDGTLQIKPDDLNSAGQLGGRLSALLFQDTHGSLDLGRAEAPALQSAPLQSAPFQTAPLPPPHHYDLPVKRNDLLIGAIRLEYPPGSGASQPEIRALKSMAPIIALALEGAMLQALALRQAADRETERQHIAQNLHDTLAQNISYLRLKLDQLTGVEAILEIGAVLQELERMRATADEAYQQVRNTLDELNPIQAADLVAELVKQAHVISQRAAFELRSSQVGNPYLLSPSARQHILYIVREALYNIEKHAHAHQVHLQFLWLDCELIIKISDDGLGFDPRQVPSEGHYGLWIMQHRAQEIGGTLKIAQVEGQGTEVTLWMPRAGHNR